MTIRTCQAQLYMTRWRSLARGELRGGAEIQEAAALMGTPSNVSS